MPAEAIALLALFAGSPEGPGPGEAVIQVKAGEVISRIAPYRTGSCIEDVYHGSSAGGRRHPTSSRR